MKSLIDVIKKKRGQAVGRLEAKIRRMYIKWLTTKPDKKPIGIEKWILKPKSYGEK